MRFFAAVLATLAVGAIAADAATDEQYSTVMVTEYTTYCPKASSTAVPQVSSSALPSITVSNGVTYSISRPLTTSTITRCNKCPSSTPISYTPSSSSVVVVPTSSPLISSSSSASSSSAAAQSTSATAPITPLATGAASRAAVGAGAGLAGVVALAAYLL